MENQSQALTVFNFEEQEIRTVVIDGEPWFVIADVCKILGINNISMATSRLDEDGVSTTEVIDSLGRKQMAGITNEPGLYQLIFQSRKAEAKIFQRWVYREIIPSIRKTGIYDPAGQIAALQQENIRLLEAMKLLEKTAEQALKIGHLENTISTADIDLWLITLSRIRLLSQKAEKAFDTGKLTTMQDTLRELHHDLEQCEAIMGQIEQTDRELSHHFSEQHRILQEFRQQALTLLPPAQQIKQLLSPKQGE